MCLKKVFKTCGKARQPPAKQHTVTLNPRAPHVGTETLRGSVVCQAEKTGPLVDQLVDQQNLFICHLFKQDPHFTVKCSYLNSCRGLVL